MSDLEKIHVQGVLSQIDSSYFPAVMLSIETEHPGVRGMDKNWQIFLTGVANGAELGFNQLGPRLAAHTEILALAYQQVSTALDMSAELDVDALEHLLAARNTLAKHLAAEWETFHDAVLGWTCSILGIRKDYIVGDGEDFDPAALGASLLLLLTRGRFHPFWVWAVETYIRRRDLHLGELRPMSMEFIRVPPVDELNELQGVIPLANAAKQYIAWAKVEYQDMQRRIKVKAEGMVVPSDDLGKWIAAEILKDTGDQ